MPNQIKNNNSIVNFKIEQDKFWKNGMKNKLEGISGNYRMKHLTEFDLYIIKRNFFFLFKCFHFNSYDKIINRGDAQGGITKKKSSQWCLGKSFFIVKPKGFS